MNPIIIDVREKDEFDAEHIEHSIHIPLSNFERQAPAFLKTLKDRPVILMCRSGKRAGLAADSAKRLCGDVACEVFDGGILAWKEQGKPTVATKKGHLPLLRQVQLTAGLLVLIGSLLAHFVSADFLFLTGFVGVGLTVAGATGFCGLAELFSRMPWNRAHPKNQEELCSVSPRSGHCSDSK